MRVDGAASFCPGSSVVAQRDYIGEGLDWGKLSLFKGNIIFSFPYVHKCLKTSHGK